MVKIGEKNDVPAWKKKGKEKRNRHIGWRGYNIVKVWENIIGGLKGEVHRLEM